MRDRFRWVFNLAGFAAAAWFVSVAIPAKDMEEIKEFITDSTGYQFAASEDVSE